MIMEELKKMFTKAKKVGVDTVLLYWTGASIFPSGNWLISEHIDRKQEK